MLALVQMSFSLKIATIFSKSFPSAGVLWTPVSLPDVDVCNSKQVQILSTVEIDFPARTIASGVTLAQQIAAHP